MSQPTVRPLPPLTLAREANTARGGATVGPVEPALFQAPCEFVHRGRTHSGSVIAGSGVLRFVPTLWARLLGARTLELSLAALGAAVAVDDSSVELAATTGRVIVRLRSPAAWRLLDAIGHGLDGETQRAWRDLTLAGRPQEYWAVSVTSSLGDRWPGEIWLEDDAVHMVPRALGRLGNRQPLSMPLAALRDVSLHEGFVRLRGPTEDYVLELESAITLFSALATAPRSGPVAPGGFRCWNAALQAKGDVIQGTLAVRGPEIRFLPDTPGGDVVVPLAELDAVELSAQGDEHALLLQAAGSRHVFTTRVAGRLVTELSVLLLLHSPTRRLPVPGVWDDEPLDDLIDVWRPSFPWLRAGRVALAARALATLSSPLQTHIVDVILYDAGLLVLPARPSRGPRARHWPLENVRAQVETRGPWPTLVLDIEGCSPVSLALVGGGTIAAQFAAHLSRLRRLRSGAPDGFTGANRRATFRTRPIDPIEVTLQDLNAPESTRDQPICGLVTDVSATGLGVALDAPAAGMRRVLVSINHDQHRLRVMADVVHLTRSRGGGETWTCGLRISDSDHDALEAVQGLSAALQRRVLAMRTETHADAHRSDAGPG